MTEVLHHYVYKIEFETGHVYYGSRTCSCLPDNDTSYLGSPITYKKHWEEFTPTKVILREFGTREEANEYENVLIEWAWSVNKSLSLNATIQGIKFNKVGISHTEETRKKISESNKQTYYNKVHLPRPEEIRRKISRSCLGKTKSFEQVDKRAYDFTLISPEGEEIKGRNISDFARKNNLCPSAIINVLKGTKFHYKGWTSSLKAHHLYLENFHTRGISYDKSKRRWAVCWYEGRENIKRFKSLDDAKKYRDGLVEQGYVFKVCVLNWKEKLKNYEPTT